MTYAGAEKSSASRAEDGMSSWLGDVGCEAVVEVVLEVGPGIRVVVDVTLVVVG